MFSRLFQNRTWWLAQCGDCQLYFTDPPPTLDDIRGFYSGTYHSDLKDKHHEKDFELKFQRYLTWVRGFVPSGRTLDIGCSTGLFPKVLMAAGYEAEGIEVNPETAEWGRRHYNVKIHIGTFEEAHLENQYDLVSLTDVLEHTVHPLRELTRIRELVKGGGHVLVTFPDLDSPSSVYLRSMAGLLQRDWIWTTCHIPLHTWEFTYKSATSMFTQAGFEVVGFRRSQSFWTERSKLGLLFFPTNIAALPLLSNWWGNQMEFMLRRR